MPDDGLQPLKVPSWLRWPPNCCQTCIGWQQDPNDQWIGNCMSGDSLEVNTRTDARYRLAQHICLNLEELKDALS